MIPARFDYEVAESVEHAVELLGAREDTKLLAGGHSLIPLLRLRFARPAVLVDLGRVDSLRYVRDAGEQNPEDQAVNPGVAHKCGEQRPSKHDR